MKVYKGASASPGLVLGQVSRLERHVETFSDGPFNPEREQRMLDEAIHTAQTELDSMAERSAPTEQAIFLFQSMMLEDEGMMNEVRFQIKAGVGAAEAMDRVGRRYAERLANMKDNAYMQLRSVDSAGSPGDPGGRCPHAHRPVQCALRHDPGTHHLRGQRPEPCRHHCPGHEHPRHRAGGPGFSGRL